MEDVLDLYAEAATTPDATRPLVCFDEQLVTLRADAHAGQPCAPGQPARVDYEYVRPGHRVLPARLRAVRRLAARDGERAPGERRVRAGDAAPGRRRLTLTRRASAWCSTT
jgi:hypothetical protein